MSSWRIRRLRRKIRRSSSNRATSGVMQVRGQTHKSGMPNSRSEPSQSKHRRTITPSSRPPRRRHQAKHSPAVATSPPAAFQANTAQGRGSAVKIRSARNGKSRPAIRTLTTNGKSQVRPDPDQPQRPGEQDGQGRQAQIREHVEVIVDAPERAVGLHQDPTKYRGFRTSHETGRPPFRARPPPSAGRTPRRRDPAGPGRLYCNGRPRSCKDPVASRPPHPALRNPRRWVRSSPSPLWGEGARRAHEGEPIRPSNLGPSPGS